MSEFVILMKGSAANADWERYITKLRDSGKFRGGSSLGNGTCISKDQADSECSVHGYLRVTVDSLDDARLLLFGNPVYESGGLIELLEET